MKRKYQFFISPPKNEMELFTRASALTGFMLGELAERINFPIPYDLRHNKGWIGLLLERYLGASSSSKALQDFAEIGIELKTIPLDARGKPTETTFVCLVPLIGNTGVIWENSYLRYKLTRVLWIPIEADRAVPLKLRHIYSPLLWSPNSQEESQLQRDWEELMDMIALGRVKEINAQYGEFLQVRPKAANSKIKTKGIGYYGQPIMTLPLGFYLKKNFTNLLFSKHFLS